MRIRQITSIFIMVIIVLVVGVPVVIAMKNISTDRHSIFHFLLDKNDALAALQSKSTLVYNPPENVVDTEGIENLSGDECTKEYLAFRLKHDYSVVNYLSSLGASSGIEDRKIVAHELGIRDYTGTREQNTRFLFVLYEKNNEMFGQRCSNSEIAGKIL